MQFIPGQHEYRITEFTNITHIVDFLKVRGFKQHNTGHHRKPITEQPKTEKDRIQSNWVVILFCNIFTQGNYEAEGEVGTKTNKSKTE